MFVELVDMMLCLGHEGYKFKLGRKASFHPLESKLDGGNFFTEISQVLVFSQPLVGNIIIEHLQSIIIAYQTPSYS